MPRKVKTRERKEHRTGAVTRRKSASLPGRSPYQKYNRIFPGGLSWEEFNDILMKALEDAPEPIHIVDSEARLIYVNSSMTNVFGWSKKEFLGQRVTMLSPDPEKAYAMFRQALDQGEGVWSGTIPCRTKDGRILLCATSVRRFRGAGGSVVATVGMTKDISEQKEMERDLKARNARLAALFNLAEKMIHNTDPSSLARECLVAANEILDLDSGAIFLADPVTGKLSPFQSHRLPSLVPEIHDKMGSENTLEGRVAKTRRPMLIPDLEETRRRLAKEGITIPSAFQSLMLTPLIARNKLVGVMTAATVKPRILNRSDLEFFSTMGIQVGIYLENSHLHQNLEHKNKALAQQNRDLEEMVSIISHELRNPLSTICGYSSLLARQSHSLSPAEVAHSTQVISRKAMETTIRLQDILNLCRLTLAAAIPPEEVDTAQVLYECLEESIPPDDRKRVRLEVPKKLPCLMGNRTQLIHILGNLLSNALKYLGDNSSPRIVISYRRETEGDGLFHVFSISDNGVGIPAGDQEKVFKLFSRSNLGMNIPGTGVGLTVVDRIVKRNGGWVNLASEEGKGTTVTFGLPWPEAVRAARGKGTHPAGGETP